MTFFEKPSPTFYFKLNSIRAKNRFFGRYLNLADLEIKMDAMPEYRDG